jgi:hypothetical protein
MLLDTSRSLGEVSNASMIQVALSVTADRETARGLVRELTFAQVVVDLLNVQPSFFRQIREAQRRLAHNREH